MKMQAIIVGNNLVSLSYFSAFIKVNKQTKILSGKLFIHLKCVKLEKFIWFNAQVLFFSTILSFFSKFEMSSRQ